ncbi:MAG: hypothetical protein LC640_11965, partial [Frankia sp.]|nr:hypothetical protein [Frankia sp.]
MPAHVSPLLVGLFDDAGMFPPARLPVADALARHRADRERAHSVLSGRFIAPATALADVAAQSAGDALDVVVVADVVGDQLVEWLGKAVADDRLIVRGVELRPMPAEAVDGAVAAVRGQFDCDVYVELPRTEAWQDVLSAIEGVAKGAGAGANAGTGAAGAAAVGVKLRCGGATAEMFPPAPMLATWLEAVIEAELPIKATAGLHGALPHYDVALGVHHHGFLNLLLAVRRALAGDDAMAALVETSVD